ncbi:MAG: outer membrane lipoprotein carrier protein LolA [Myxococcota bacterium]
MSFTLALAALALSASTVPTEQDASQRAVRLAKRVHAHYSKVTDLEAEFVQTYVRVALSRPTEKRGRIAIKKPYKVFMSYPSQGTRTYVDGESVWYYKEGEDTAVRQPLDKEQFDSFSFFTGSSALEENFSIGSEAPEVHLPKGLEALVLTPKRGAQYRRVVLGVEPKTGVVLTTVMTLTSGDINRFDFKKVRTNVGLDDDRFEFSPPKGVEVVEP